MFDLPLHPKLVHLPLGLVTVLPLVVAGLAVAIRKEWLPPRAWWLGVFLAVVTAGGAWLASEVGEREAEKVERIVAESLVEQHEEAGEQFVTVAAICALVILVSSWFQNSRSRSVAHLLSTLFAIAAFVMALRAGHLGGELVYRHDAADAFIPSPRSGESVNNVSPRSSDAD